MMYLAGRKWWCVKMHGHGPRYGAGVADLVETHLVVHERYLAWPADTTALLSNFLRFRMHTIDGLNQRPR